MAFFVSLSLPLPVSMPLPVSASLPVSPSLSLCVSDSVSFCLCLSLSVSLPPPPHSVSFSPLSFTLCWGLNQDLRQAQQALYHWAIAKATDVLMNGGFSQV